MKILTGPRVERCIGCLSCSIAWGRLVDKPRDPHGLLAVHLPGLTLLPASLEIRLPARKVVPCEPFLGEGGGGVVARKDQCIHSGDLHNGFTRLING